MIMIGSKMKNWYHANGLKILFLFSMAIFFYNWRFKFSFYILKLENLSCFDLNPKNSDVT